MPDEYKPAPIASCSSISPRFPFALLFVVPVLHFLFPFVTSQYNQTTMRSDLALNFLLSMAVLFSAMVQAAPTNNIHPSPLIFAIQKVALTPSTSDFISKFSAVGFDRGVDKSHIVRVRSSDFGLDETVLSDLNLTDTEIRETKSCYTTCSLPISSDQSLRSDCQKAAQKSSL